MMVRVVVFVMVLMVLAVVPTAAACGWVVWAWVKPLSSPGRLFWNITTKAFETKAECDAVADQEWKRNKSNPERRYDEQYHCFPAGTDPRERAER